MEPNAHPLGEFLQELPKRKMTKALALMLNGLPTATCSPELKRMR